MFMLQRWVQNDTVNISNGMHVSVILYQRLTKPTSKYKFFAASTTDGIFACVGYAFYQGG